MDKVVLVADDEREIVELIELYLKKENFKVLKAYNGIDALEHIKNENIDLAIVDIMMPGIDGFSVIREARLEKHIPIIVLSAKQGSEDKILGLEVGADDYITKPFCMEELIARIKAQLRRYYTFKDEGFTNGDVIRIRDLSLDTEMCSLSKNGIEINLTYTEYKIMKMFMENTNKVFTKQKIFETVWEDSYLQDSNVIMVHMSKIRDKIEDGSKENPYIKTIRGLGYRMEVPKSDGEN